MRSVAFDLSRWACQLRKQELVVAGADRLYWRFGFCHVLCRPPAYRVATDSLLL